MKYVDENDNLMIGKVIKHVGIALAGLLTLTLVTCNSPYTIEQGERGVHLRGGALVGIEQPGLKLKIPFYDSIKRMSVRNQTVSWQQSKDGDSRMESYSKDQQPAHISATVTWELQNDEKTLGTIFSTFGSVDGVFNAIIVPKAAEAVKNVFGTYDAVTVIQNRAKFNADVATEYARLLQGFPVKLNGIQIQDIAFSDAYEQAVEARMKAQVEVQKAEQEKQTAQISADVRVLNAEADAKRTRLAGDAEAAAIKARSDALASSPKLVELTLAEKWDGHLPTTMVPGQSVPFLGVK